MSGEPLCKSTGLLPANNCPGASGAKREALEFSDDECLKCEDEARAATGARCGWGEECKGSTQGRAVEEGHELEKAV